MARPVVIRAAALFDGEDMRERPATEILVIDGRIAELGDTVPRPDDVEVIDLTGYTVSPGFIDAHVHSGLTLDRMLSTFYTESSVLKALHSLPGLAGMLNTGFTTVRDLGGLDTEYATVGLKKGIELGLITGPRMIVAPHIMSGTSGHGEPPQLDSEFRIRVRGVVDGPDAIRGRVREEILNGADWIKVALTGFFGDRPGEGHGHMSWTLAELEACVEAARDLDVDVAVHAISDESVKRAIQAGVRSIEHGSLMSQETLDLAEETGTYLVPTMRIIRDMFSGAVVSVNEVQDGNEAGLPTDGIFALKDDLLESQALIAQSNAKVVYGSDASGKSPLDLWGEFTAMVEYGVDPLRALRSATTLAAEMLRRPDLGALRVGALADVIALDGDPLTDIDATHRVTFVMKEGVVHKRV
ncbi:MAG TPA: amidohydrolase family protein [Pseudolysinimonas sp.]|nr:amidohydrolase family protein [Pseudolysinimonas sp.]